MDLSVFLDTKWTGNLALDQDFAEYSSYISLSELIKATAHLELHSCFQNKTKLITYVFTMERFVLNDCLDSLHSPQINLITY